MPQGVPPRPELQEPRNGVTIPSTQILLGEGARMFTRLLLLAGGGLLSAAITFAQAGGGKTRLAVVGLDHDHVWGLLKDIAGEPDGELVERAKSLVPASVKFYG